MQRLVAGTVAEGVVVGLEVVDVEQDQGQVAAKRLARSASRLSSCSKKRRLCSPVSSSVNVRARTAAWRRTLSSANRKLAGDRGARREAGRLEGDEAHRTAGPHERQDGEAPGLLARGQAVAPEAAGLGAGAAARLGLGRRSRGRAG